MSEENVRVIVRKATGVLFVVLALLLAGCFDGDEDSTTEARTTETRLSPEPKTAQVARAAALVAQAGNGWAPLFAKNYLWACKYVYPPAWEGPGGHRPQPPVSTLPKRFVRRWCAGFGLQGGPGPNDPVRPEPLRGRSGRRLAPARPPSGFQKSFADATVERILVNGDKAWAEFSNGELVEFIRVAQAELPIDIPGGWYIYRVGGNAGKKYFEP
jgi:hypothetical protein